MPGLAREPAPPKSRHLAFLTLAALGVVYGDLGTSPLYALQASFQGAHALPVTPANILGVLSLFIWALVLVVCVKYLTLLVRLDNHGEGGILALVAMLSAPGQREGPAWLVGLGLLGAALLFGDGAITPSISVLSAVEGLAIATPGIARFVVPITVIVLLALFLVQPLGIGRVGAMFGPIVALWFVSIGCFGAWGLLRAPEVLEAFNPVHAVRFFLEHGWRGVPTLGAVVLCLTGAEALYADLGGFGRRPIRIGWFALALPSLLLSYLSQGALLLRHPEASSAPFFHSLPERALLPMVGLATLATVIASQALIAAVTSLVHQSVQLGYLPRLSIRHTSSEHRAQIYIPVVNWTLMLSCISLVLAFRSSDRLAAAYGLAVSGTMAFTTVLFTAVAHRRGHWPGWGLALVVSGFLAIDLAFLSANLLKLPEGGWLPLAMGLGAFAVMEIWHRGTRLLLARANARPQTLGELSEALGRDPPPRVPGTAVFLSVPHRGVPPVLRAHLKHNGVLHTQVVLLSLDTVNVPTVSDEARVRVASLGHGLTQVTARQGFMEHPDVPQLLERAREQGLEPLVEPVTFYLNRVSLRVGPGGGLPLWAKRLFRLMHRNATPATAHLRLPVTGVMELGSQVEL